MLPPEEFGFRDMASQAVLMVLGLSCHLVNRTRDPIVPKKHYVFPESVWAQGSSNSGGL